MPEAAGSDWPASDIIVSIRSLWRVWEVGNGTLAQNRSCVRCDWRFGFGRCGSIETMGKGKLRAHLCRDYCVFDDESTGVHAEQVATRSPILGMDVTLE